MTEFKCFIKQMRFTWQIQNNGIQFMQTLGIEPMTNVLVELQEYILLSNPIHMLFCIFKLSSFVFQVGRNRQDTFSFCPLMMNKQSQPNKNPQKTRSLSRTRRLTKKS